MITSGAQVRAARGFLGWSQADLAKAAGLHVNVIRLWEAKHGEIIRADAAYGYSSERITRALHKAGLELWHDPPGVRVNPDVYRPDATPPIYERWEKHWKPQSKRGQRREYEASFARRVSAAHGLTLKQGVAWYRRWWEDIQNRS